MSIKEVQNEECSLDKQTGEDEFMKQPNRIGVAIDEVRTELYETYGIEKDGDLSDENIAGKG